MSVSPPLSLSLSLMAVLLRKRDYVIPIMLMIAPYVNSVTLGGSLIPDSINCPDHDGRGNLPFRGKVPPIQRIRIRDHVIGSQEI